MKVLLNRSDMNGHTLGVQLQTEKLEPPCIADLSSTQNYCFMHGFHTKVRIFSIT